MELHRAILAEAESSDDSSDSDDGSLDDGVDSEDEADVAAT